MGTDGCFDADGEMRWDIIEKTSSIDADYERLQKQKENLSTEEYERRLHELCVDILEREG